MLIIIDIKKRSKKELIEVLKNDTRKYSCLRYKSINDLK